MTEKNCSGHISLKVEIDHIKEDIAEIKSEAKETNHYYRDVIDALKENSISQTEILKNQERQFTGLNNDISAVNNDIAGLRNDMKDNLESQTKWYQDFLSDTTGKVLKILLIVILILSGIKIAGIDITKLLTGL